MNKDVIRLLESLEEQEVKGFNRGAHSKLETMQTAESERYLQPKIITSRDNVDDFWIFMIDLVGNSSKDIKATLA